MRSIAVALLALVLAACGNPSPGDAFVGQWSGDGGTLSIEAQGDSYILRDSAGGAALPLTVSGDQLVSNTPAGNLIIIDDQLHFAGYVFWRLDEQGRRVQRIDESTMGR